jgi:hypothetical protein
VLSPAAKGEVRAFPERLQHVPEGSVMEVILVAAPAHSEYSILTNG